MQQAVWRNLPGGLFPLATFVQCCIDICKHNFVVFPHMKITQSLSTCITKGMTEIRGGEIGGAGGAQAPPIFKVGGGGGG